MPIRSRDVSIFLYNLGVTVAGAWVALRLGSISDPVTLAALGLLCVGWTIYFRYSMAPRLEEIDARTEQRNPTEE